MSLVTDAQSYELDRTTPTTLSRPDLPVKWNCGVNHRAYNPKKRCDFVVSCRTPPRVGGCLLEIRILREKP